MFTFASYVIVFFIGNRNRRLNSIIRTVLLFKADRYIERYGAEAMWEEGEKDTHRGLRTQSSQVGA